MTGMKSVYGRWRGRLGAGALAIVAACGALLGVVPHPARAQGADATVLDARDAFRRKDRNRLAAARAAAAAERNPLAMWVDYWELTNRIGEAQQPEVDAFAQRWRGTYVEDRLRNDWLLELGRRRDWANFAVDFPRFRMNDDREVTCYSLARRPARRQGRARRGAPRPGSRSATPTTAAPCWRRRCSTRSSSSTANVWRKVRFAIDAGRPRAARQAACCWSARPRAARSPMSSTARRATSRAVPRRSGRVNAELTTLALMRMATNDPDAAAALLSDRWERRAARPTSRPGPGRSVAKQAAIQAAARGRRLLPARRRRFGQGRCRGRSAGRHAGLEGARRAARRRRQAALAAGACRRSTR